MKDSITLEEVLEVLEYVPETGYLINKVTRNPRAKKGERAGARRPDGYRVIQLNKKSFFEHRLIWFIVHKKWPKYTIDHINNIKDDNRIENLRDITQSNNSKNRNLQSNNTCGYRGVTYHRPTNTWAARLWSKGKSYTGGYHKCIHDAALEYNFMAYHINGEFARYNRREDYKEG